ncbi:unnamed protein product, partial [Vitis vinifera]|uniref:Uncharacterized protein n=1 Tax=Vitis vinifera TaxID=29760 RepID=D7U3Z1_VITVI
METSSRKFSKEKDQILTRPTVRFMLLNRPTCCNKHMIDMVMKKRTRILQRFYTYCSRRLGDALGREVG